MYFSGFLLNVVLVIVIQWTQNWELDTRTILNITLGVILWPLLLPINIIKLATPAAKTLSRHLCKNHTAEEHPQQDQPSNTSELTITQNTDVQLQVQCIIDPIARKPFEEQCLICWNEMTPRTIHYSHDATLPITPSDTDICVTSCAHVLHFRCLLEWFRESSSCPLCRSVQIIQQCKIICTKDLEQLSTTVEKNAIYTIQVF